MKRDSFFDDEEPTPSQARETLQLSVEQALIVNAFLLEWVDGGRTIKSRKCRAEAWRYCTGTRFNVKHKAKQLLVSRERLHRVIADCKRYRAERSLG